MALSIDATPTTSVPIVLNRDDVIYIDHTRIPLDTVVDAFLKGATPEEICYQYPSLSLETVYSVIGYYLGNRTEIDAYLTERRRAAAAIRRENEARFPPDGVRARLLARRQQQSG